MKKVSYSPLGDRAIVVDFSDDMDLKLNRLILNWKKALETSPFRGFIEAVPAYTTLTIYYDPTEVGVDSPYETVKKYLQKLHIPKPKESAPLQIVDIPVCYEKPFSLDIEFVAMHNNLTIDEVIDLHSRRLYDVYFLGFSPGFPFLGGMDENISAPRKNTPRLNIPAGAVGIAGGQTGIYPLQSPGGWQIIGRTPLKLFQLNKNPPTLIEPGNQIRFIPITLEQYHALEESQ